MKKLLGSAVLTAAVAFSQAPDMSKVEIKTNRLGNNFAMLEGQGGQIGVLYGPDGTFMVDTQFAPLSDKIAAAVKALSPNPIKFVVNTHVHGDHTGGNENFAKMGATLIAREELRNRLAHPNPQANGQPGVVAPAMALPSMTYVGTLTLKMNGEEVRVIAIPRAHTDGDSIVHFVNNDVIMTGDYYRSIQFPNVDRANGGSVRGLIDGLSRVIAIAGPNTRIIPGHGAMVTRAEVMAHRDMAVDIAARVGEMIKQGKTLEEVQTAKVNGPWESKVKEAAMTGDRFVGQVYADLKANN
jgi:glyoxylase-like metal-dependent hydrolase (beta-lactamase superfamily II)